MKKKDILPCMGRGFIAGTLAVQTLGAYNDHKMGSLIGLAASFIIFVVMNYNKSCAAAEGCDVPKPKLKKKLA